MVGPCLENIALISQYGSLEEVSTKCVRVPLGNRLVSRSSWLGKACVWLHSHVDAATQSPEDVIDRTKREFYTFIDFLEKKDVTPNQSFLDVSFDREWQCRFKKAYTVFGLQGSMPSLDRAQNEAAPKILESIIASEMPWELFSKLMRKGSLSDSEVKCIKKWIKAVKFAGDWVSPFLLLSVFEKAASNCFLQDTSRHTFLLTWKLYTLGCNQLIANEQGRFFTDRFGTPIQVGPELPLEMPFDLPIKAYETTKDDQMVVLSSAPLYLGMWLYSCKKDENTIPCIRSFLCDKRGQFAVVERVECSLDDDIWKCKDQEQKLIDELAKMLSFVVKGRTTPDLRLEHIFVTSESEIRTFLPIKEKLEYFFLPEIELFVRKVCRNDQEKIKKLFLTSGIYEHSQAQLFRGLLENWGVQLFSDRCKEVSTIECKVHGIDNKLLSIQFSDWLDDLKKHLRRVRRACKQREWNLHDEVLNEAFIEGVLALQKEIGFISLLPNDLDQHVVSWLERNKPKEIAFKEEKTVTQSFWHFFRS